MAKTKITEAQFIEMLHNIKGVTFASVTLATEPRMRKTDNPYFGHVRKIATHSVCLGFNYENSVNNQRKREGVADKFEAAATWGEHESAAHVNHKGVDYMQAKLQKTLETVYIDEVNNVPLDAALLMPFMPEKSSNDRQGVDKEVLVIKPKISNIVAVKMNGNEYEITH